MSEIDICEETIIGKYINEKNKLRNQMIKEIEKETKRSLICFIANFGHPLGGIYSGDIMGFEDLIKTVKKPNEVDLLISSPGGELTTTEKILFMCRERFKNFRVIIPNAAKSGATMIALGSDKIVMGYLSELGPIDPQIPRILPNGKMMLVPANSLLNSLERIKESIKKKEPPEVFMPLLAGFNIEMIDICEKAIEESADIAEKWLKNYMLKKKPKKATEIAKILGDTTKYKSHGKLISGKEAKKLGLDVELLDKKSKIWNLIWEYYCRAELYLNETGAVKLFENNCMSLTQGAQEKK